MGKEPTTWIALPKEQLEEIMNYIMRRPFVEVQHLAPMFNNVRMVEKLKETSDVKDEPTKP